MSKRAWCYRSGMRTGVRDGMVLCGCGRHVKVVDGRIVRHRVAKAAA